MVEIKCYKSNYEGVLQASSEIEELAWFTGANTNRTTNTGRLILEWLKEEDWID